MNRIYKLLTIILVMFVFITSVSAVTITTNNSVSGTVDTSSKLVTNTGTLTVTNAGGDTLKTYKVVDVFYNSTTNNVTYEFTTLFKAYLASTNGQSPDYHSLTVDQYMTMTGSSTSSGTVPTSSTTLDALMSGFAQYIRANDSTATATMITSNGNATTTAAAGAYLILPSSTSDVYSVMVGNVKLVPGSNNTWDIEGTTIAAKKSRPNITKYFYDYRNVTCNGGGLNISSNDIRVQTPPLFSYHINSSPEVTYNKSIKYDSKGLLAYEPYRTSSNSNCQYNASYNIGEEYDYIITATVPTYPPDATNAGYYISDIFTPGISLKGVNYITIKDGNTTLTIDSNGNVKNGNIVVGEIGYSLTYDEDDGQAGFGIDLDYTKITSTTITVQYTAYLNNDALIANQVYDDNDYYGNFEGRGNENYAYMDYSNDPYGNGGDEVWDKTRVFTYAVGVWKYDAALDSLGDFWNPESEDYDALVNPGDYMLNGATFAIYDNSTCTGSPLGTFTTSNQSYPSYVNVQEYYDGGGGTTIYRFAPNSNTLAYDRPVDNNTLASLNLSTGGDGVAFYEGLKAGTYCIKETVAPAGYRLDTTPHIIQVGPGQNNSIALSNTAQGLLPATGGIGTYIYMIVGAIIVVGSITVIYILNKKRKEA